MSCSGCRVLRKGCNENCILRQSLQNIESPQAQANATVFVAKFFGRADLMSFLSSVPQSQRPALFQSLLFEACGRTVNPVNGAMGLLWTGNWHLCQSAVETVLRGRAVRVLPEFFGWSSTPESDDSLEAYDSNFFPSQDLNLGPDGFIRNDLDDVARIESNGVVDLGLTSGLPARMTKCRREKGKSATPSRNSEESETTTLESVSNYHPSLEAGRETKLLRLFV